MRVYLAAPYAGRDILKEDLPAWEQAGHEITCGWVKGTRPLGAASYGISEMSTDDEVTAHANMDLADIEAAEVLVHYTAEYLTRYGLDPAAHNLHSGGRHVETGYAFGMSIPVIVIGEQENIFQRGLCLTATDRDDAIRVIKEFL